MDSNRFDALDREAFQQMIESEPFRKLQARIAGELKRAEEACVRSDDEREVRRGQGAVAALRTVMDLPGRLLAEMKKK